MRKRTIWLWCLGFLLLSAAAACSPQPQLQPDERKTVEEQQFQQADNTLLVENSDYILGKYEPERGAYLGSYVIQDTHVNSSMAKFNELTGRRQASYFRYVGYGQPFPTEWAEDVKSVGAVPHIAFEPNNGLDEVRDDDYLRQFARDAKASGVPVFLRYASEMNGAWLAYTGDPQKYIAKWRLVHDVMAQEAPNVMMVWTVFTFPQKTIPIYYPGDDYVDWVGVNIYNVVYHNDDIQQPAMEEDPLQLLDFVYNMFAEKKPIQISEYGVTHYTTTDNKEYVDYAVGKLRRLYQGLPVLYPRVKSIFYFDVDNVQDGVEGRRINNYSVTDDPQVLSAYRQVTADPYYLEKVGTDLEGQSDAELVKVKEAFFSSEGELYITPEILAKYFATDVKTDQDALLLEGQKGMVVMYAGETEAYKDGVKIAVDKPMVLQDRKLYIPLTTIAGLLGREVHYDGDWNAVTISLP